MEINWHPLIISWSTRPIILPKPCYVMRTLLLLFISLLASQITKSQSLAGSWRSADSTRIYQVYENDQLLEAVLEKSTRATDHSGVQILTLVEKVKEGKYKGLIHSADGQLVTMVTIKFIGDEKLKLRLRRFLIPVYIHWYKVK